MNSQTEYESDNESVNTEQVFEENVAVPPPTQPEGTATIGGMRTAYDERSAFVEKLQELFAKIDDLNRPTPMNEGEYLEFADLIKDLNQFASLFKKNDPIFVRLVASARRGERKASQSVIAKAEDKDYKWCERCDTHIKKKGWAKHRKSERCIQIFNSKKLAVNITNVERDKVGRFAKTPIHPFYLIGQSLVSLFGRQKALDPDRIVPEWDAVRLPIQTQQYEDEVGTLASFYEPQEDFSGVFANVPAERNLTLAVGNQGSPTPPPIQESMGLKGNDEFPSAEETEEPVPKAKKVRNKKVEVPLAEATEETITIKVKKPKKKIIIVEPETPPPIQESMGLKGNDEFPSAEVPRRYVAEGLMSRSFYQAYIRPNMSVKGQNLMDAVYGDCEDDEMGAEYRVCSWGNPEDHIYEYSELWLLDCEPNDEGFYYPVVVGEINTSSTYAMCRCGMDRDPDEEEEQYLMKTDAEIMEMVKPHNHDKILQILQSKRKDGK